MAELLPDPVFFASLPKVYASGAVILRDQEDRVLVEKPTYRDHWLLPGGHVDPDEDVRETARREVREELGLVLEVGRLLTVDWLPARPESGRPMGVHFVFDGGVHDAADLEARIVLQESELEAWRFVPEAELGLLSAWGRRRALAALRVLRGQESADLFGFGGS
ncbi:NUDIX domain-containing protein [Brachybacterium hainanense]|uniref:NUDIX domain-containing protein n=1 Tax=Brachybacterium hainanense TaxID=1541174 RepID=A0ABV6RA17_9MICO